MLNNGKATIENVHGIYTITVPSKKNWFFNIFGLVWLGGWFFGFINAFKHLGSGPNGVNSFLAIWLIGWSIGGIAIITFLLWGLFGKESIQFDRKEIKFSQTVFGIGKKKTLIREEVKNFRFVKVDDSMFGRNRLALVGIGAGKIKFDYGLKTYSFAQGVDDAEANHLINELTKKIQE